MLVGKLNEISVIAPDAVKGGDFTCPECAQPLVLKQGRVKVAHFAHKAASGCENGKGESQDHLQCKYEIFQALKDHPRISHLQLERRLQGVRPDISFALDGTHKIAVEVQISTLPISLIEHRTRVYAQKSFYLLWCSPYSIDGPQETEQPFAPRDWQKYIHALYFGRIFFWMRGQTLLPVHLTDHMLSSEGGYDQDGEYHDGYTRRSKRYRNVDFEEEVQITELVPTERGAWKAASISIPSCKLLTYAPSRQ